MAKVSAVADKLRRAATPDIVEQMHALVDPVERINACKQARDIVNEISDQLAEIYRASVLEMRDEGRTLAAIAQTLGVSHHRLHLIITKAREGQQQDGAT